MIAREDLFGIIYVEGGVAQPPLFMDWTIRKDLRKIFDLSKAKGNDAFAEFTKLMDKSVLPAEKMDRIK